MRTSTNAFLVVVLGGLMLIATLLLLLPGSLAPEESASVASTEDDGWRALFLLLDELGYDARPFTAVPADLPRSATLVMAKAPPYPLQRPLTDAGEPRGGRDPLHYRRFLEGGGTLVALADEDMTRFLAEELGLAAVEPLEWVGSWGATVFLADGQALDLEVSPQVASPESLPPGSRALATNLDGEAFAVALSVGDGTLVLVSPDSERWSNAYLARGERAVVFVRLLEAAHAPRTVLFDEYALGGWTPDTPVELAFGPKAFLFSAHLCVLAALLLWRAAWVRAFPRDPEPLPRVSALARARSLARLLEPAAAGRAPNP